MAEDVKSRVQLTQGMIESSETADTLGRRLTDFIQETISFMPIRDCLGRNHYVNTHQIVEFYDLSAPDS